MHEERILLLRFAIFSLFACVSTKLYILDTEGNPREELDQEPSGFDYRIKFKQQEIAKISPRSADQYKTMVYDKLLNKKHMLISFLEDE